MRPVDRGAEPDSYDGADYKNAQQPLVASIGSYCSYCERYIPSAIDIEHKRPKSLYPGMERDWDNFLLACSNCNSPKNNRDRVVIRDRNDKLWIETDAGQYPVWPDTLYTNANHHKDTFNLIKYKELGLLEVHPNVPTDEMKDRVRASLMLVNLGHILNDGKAIKNIWFFRLKGRLQKYSRAAGLMSGLKLSGDAPLATLMKACPKNQKTPPTDKLVCARNLPTTRDDYADAIRGEEGPLIKDYRVVQRSQVWDIAMRFRDKFDRLIPGNYTRKGSSLVKKPTNPTSYSQTISGDDLARRIKLLTAACVECAKAKGFWSVWVTVFQAHPNDPASEFALRPAIIPVLQGLLKHENFPGTRSNDQFLPNIYDPLDHAWENAVNQVGRPDKSVTINTLTQEKDDQAKQIEALKQTNADCQQQTKTLQSSNQQLKDQNNQLAQEKGALQDSHDRLQTERNDLQGKHDALAENNRQLQSDKGRLTTEKQQSENATAAMRDERDQKQARIDDLTAHNRQLQAELEECRRTRQQAPRQSTTTTTSRERPANTQRQDPDRQPPPATGEQGGSKKRKATSAFDEPEDQGGQAASDPGPESANKRIRLTPSEPPAPQGQPQAPTQAPPQTTTQQDVSMQQDAAQGDNAESGEPDPNRNRQTGQ